MDTLARALLAAAELIESGELQRFADERYAGWSREHGRSILDGKQTLADLWQRASASANEPRPSSGRQEFLENVVREAIERSARR